MTKNTKIVLGVVVLVVIVVLIAVFYKPASKETIKIGAILPLTGKASNLGEDMRQAINLALEEINRQRDRKIEVIYEDEKCDPKEAVSGYKNLVSIHGVKIIIGAGC